MDVKLTSSLRYLSAPVLIGIFSLIIYSINLERAPHHDEFYHMLAAKGVLATGEPAIGEDGRYWRGYPWTWLVARSFELFGESLTAGRLPSVVLMAALVVLLFEFLRREAGGTAGWLGAGLFAVSPFAIEIAQFIRFYSVQCLAFFAAAWLVYAIARGPFRPQRQLPMAALALFLVAFAFYFQPTTLLGVAGLGLWFAGALLLPWLSDSAVPRSQKVTLLLVLATAGLVILGLAWGSGLLASLWRDYRTTALFNQPYVNQFWFYHAWYSLFYPTLWTLSGLLAILALIRWPRPAGFFVVVFATGFLLNSFAAAKGMRYLAYAQPFLFGLWGLGLAAVLEGAFLRRARGELAARLPLLPPRFARTAAGGLVVLAVLFTIIANPAWLRSTTLLAGITIPPQLPPTRWLAAKPALERWVEQADVVVTTEDLAMLYYYGRADYLLSTSRLGEQPVANQVRFIPDFRTDVPIVPDQESFDLVLNCHASGLFVTQAGYWVTGERTRADVEEVSTLMLDRARPLELPAESRLVAFVWNHEVPTPRPAACAVLPR
jgi:hypothetical protein